ncbi:dihydroflavonol-4-reductase [Sporothrix schenckii 1099-18]|uniref:Dihydroflavonol-4-reductase n=1 Tax=Sporothrix schenckii 1099-18 TaxID=1397361 RepID=A0A0F2M6B6_SPOSC|nr:dihydroflavonol-4-reductase [Sporothrix schenckii 1099-18]KJR84345.1 dihydroflavonol-4-reductase [Sporothrix schenckii 1099-18]
MAPTSNSHSHPAGRAPGAFEAHSPDDIVDTPSGVTDAAHAKANSATIVLVTEGSGFLASHLILQLLAAGYAVRTTLNSLSQEDNVRKSLRIALTAAGADVDGYLARLHFFASNLASDNGWADAVRGCTYIHHTLSGDAPKDGVLRVLRAAQETTVHRVILTSSFATIGYGHPQESSHVFTENEWSVDDKNSLPAYHRGLLQAERAAWEYVQGLPAGGERHGNKLQLTVLNPVGTYGPALPGLPPPAPSAIQHLLDGTWSALPDLHLGIVDVRDLADLHVRAMTASEETASGQRFLAAADGRPVSLSSIAMAIRKERPALAKARKVPSISVPNWVARAASMVGGSGGSGGRNVSSHLGPALVTNNEKAKGRLGWRPRPVFETIMDTVDSVVAEESRMVREAGRH